MDDRIEAEGSSPLGHSKNHAGPEPYRYHATMMRKAYRRSAEIDAKSITSPEITDLIKKKLQELEDKLPHPEPDKPNAREAIGQTFTDHRVPKVTQSAEATKKIINNVQSILNRFDTMKEEVDKEQLREIAALVSLANELCDKGYRNRGGTDQRPTAEIKAELVMYQKAADRLEQQEKALCTGQPLPKIDKTLAHRLEHLLTQKKLEKLNMQTESLMSDFEKLFPEAAQLIRKDLLAMQLVLEATTASVGFGGYAEEGPAKESSAYTSSDKRVYIPKTSTNPKKTMNRFLFELTNGINEPRLREVHKRGWDSIITAKEYAREIAEIEVEALLRVGEIRFHMRENSSHTKEGWKKLGKLFLDDHDFYLSIYRDYKEKRLSKDDIVKIALKDEVGGKSHEQRYIDQYNYFAAKKQRGYSPYWENNKLK